MGDSGENASNISGMETVSAKLNDNLLKKHKNNGYSTLDDIETPNGHETRNGDTNRKQSIFSVGHDFIYQAKASVFSSGINICNANIGAGILGLGNVFIHFIHVLIY